MVDFKVVISDINVKLNLFFNDVDTPEKDYWIDVFILDVIIFIELVRIFIIILLSRVCC